MALPPALQQRRDAVVAAEVDNPTPNPFDSSAPQPQTDQINTQQTQQPQQPQQQQAPINADAAAEQAANMPLEQDPELAGFFDGELPQPTQPAPQQPQAQQPQPQPQPQPQTQTQPTGMQQGVDTDALAVVRAQQQVIDMLSRNNAGAAQANPTAPTAGSPAATQTKPFFNIDATELTEEERKFFNGNEALFEKFVARAIQQHVADPMNRLAQQQQEATQTATASATNAEQRAFAMSLSSRIPDVQSVYRTPQFATFLNEYVPEAGATRRELLTSATKTYNVGLIEAHVNEFKRRSGQQPAQTQTPQPGQPPQRATTPAPAGMVQPQSNPTQAVPQQAQPRRMITPEKLNEAQQLMMRGKLSGEKFNKLVAAFKGQQDQQLQSMGYQGNA